MLIILHNVNHAKPFSFLINSRVITHLIAHFYYLPLFNYPQQLLNDRIICLKVTIKVGLMGLRVNGAKRFRFRSARVLPHYLFFLDPQGLAVLTAFIWTQ